jgi:fumarylacetoacetase
MDDADLLLPATVRQFSDMCVSTFHIGSARGSARRDEPDVPKVFKWLPVGYNGRASSVVVSSTPVARPNGEWLEQEGVSAEPSFGPEPRQDYELEVGIWLGGPGNRLGTPIPIGEADNHIFGYCLLNDWSARGIQMWETMLGPFLGKSQSTTVSPWIVTAEALAPFRTAAFQRPAGDPAVLPHLRSDADQSEGGFDMELEALVLTPAMREARTPPARICLTNFKHMYWTAAQMVTHHASNGCNMGTGDLLGSGTCSGPEESGAACLLETTLRGTRDWSLPNGERRRYLEDGDEVVLRGRASREGYVSVGFGDCAGRLTPAPKWPG